MRLTIFGVTGRVVRTLADHTEGPGSRVAQWNGLDEAANRVASGVYFYALDAGDAQRVVRRVVVVK